MATITQHAPGTFCWPELATTDQPAAKAFYGKLFGWDCSDMDMGGGESYTMLMLGGRTVGALYSMRKEERSQGIPPHWNSYVSVASVDESAAKAASLGGTVILPGMDVFDSGRLAFIQDPTGAMFGLWQAKNHPGAGVLDEIGALCWTELMTHDTGRAQGFYTGLFGWQTEAMPMGPERTYTMFKRGETQAAGMMQITPEMGPVPPHWMIYFAVDDCDGAVAKAQSLGAGITVPATDIPDIGRFAILRDPQGAHFAVFKLAGMP